MTDQSATMSVIKDYIREEFLPGEDPEQLTASREKRQ